MATILVVADDDSLLETRAAVLRTTGAETVSSRSSSALDILADWSFDLVVLCHSVKAPICSDLVKAIRARLPQTRILGVSPYRGMDVDDAAVDAISSAAPADLVINTNKQLKLIEQAAHSSKFQSSPALPGDAAPQASE